MTPARCGATYTDGVGSDTVPRERKIFAGTEHRNHGVHATCTDTTLGRRRTAVRRRRPRDMTTLPVLTPPTRVVDDVAARPRYSLVVSSDREHRLAAQRLRYNVFATEPGFTGPDDGTGRDADRRALRPPAGPRRPHRHVRRLLPDASAGRGAESRRLLHGHRIRYRRTGSGRQPDRRDGPGLRAGRPSQRVGAHPDVGRHPALHPAHRLRMG